MKMGKITRSSLALICLLAASLAGPLPAAPPPVSMGGRYTDGLHHFSLVVPLGWTINKELIPHYAVFVEPNKSAQDEAATVGTYGEPLKNLTLDQYVRATRKGNAAQKGLTVSDERETMLGGLPAHTWRMHVSLPGYAPHENRQVFSVRGNQAVSLTLTALPGAIKNYDAVFDAMLASFHWEGSKAALETTLRAKSGSGASTHLPKANAAGGSVTGKK